MHNVEILADTGQQRADRNVDLRGGNTFIQRMIIVQRKYRDRKLDKELKEPAIKDHPDHFHR